MERQEIQAYQRETIDWKSTDVRPVGLLCNSTKLLLHAFSSFPLMYMNECLIGQKNNNFWGVCSVQNRFTIPCARALRNSFISKLTFGSVLGKKLQPLRYKSFTNKSSSFTTSISNRGISWSPLMTPLVKPRERGSNNMSVRAVLKAGTVLYDCDHPLRDEILPLPSYFHCVVPRWK